MKRIILMRHGQAEDGTDGIPDFERSLTTRGKNVTRAMAARLKEKISDPGVLISSPAFRAYETALIFAMTYRIPAEKLRLAGSIYSRFDPETLREILSEAGNEAVTVTLFGHNPSFTEVSSYYSNESINMVPKSGIVSLTFWIKNWTELRPGTGNLEIFYEPKKIL